MTTNAQELSERLLSALIGAAELCTIDVRAEAELVRDGPLSAVTDLEREDTRPRHSSFRLSIGAIPAR